MLYPIRRRRYTRRRTLRRPRRSLRRFPVKRSGLVRRKVHNFKRTFTNTLTVTNQADLAGAMFFQLDQLPDYSEFELFDEYRILAIRAEFVPEQNSFEAYDTAAPTIFTVIDHCDTDTPANLNELLQYETLRKSVLKGRHKRYFKCSTLISNQVNGGTDVSQVAYRKWFAMRSPDIQHYGLKYYVPHINTDPETTNSMTINCYFTYYFQCKSVQ